MATGYVLYNSKAGNINSKNEINLLQGGFQEELRFIEISDITSYTVFFNGISSNDFIIIAGGDGTLNRFVNDTKGIEYKNDVLYFPVGSGNDFARDLGYSKGQSPFTIKEYLKDLPTVNVNGNKRLFINGVGYGIDGYCCEMGDKLRKNSNKPVNYTSIAIKGLLFDYKPTRATVTVDGASHTYENVWLAPIMNGSYYGGGMMPTPRQSRRGGTLSVMVFHCKSKLRALMVFPSIFKGEHVKHTDIVEVMAGKEVAVEFDRPTPLQIDGET
ncbi:MAG: diacylglycerol kinase family protein, partial [Clostridia bacterium]|nr:diacylglycerol kinase family protein [Clostridia bacterium]